MKNIIAKNPKNQVKVNKAVNWLVKHNAYNDERNQVSDNLGEDCKEWRRINKKCEDSFDKYLEYLEELPKREQAQITKSELY
jgi:hypothetical protein